MRPEKSRVWLRLDACLKAFPIEAVFAGLFCITTVTSAVAKPLPPDATTTWKSGPRLTALTHAKDYAARLDLYDGEFQKRGGGMTATVYVRPDTDVLVIAYLTPLEREDSPVSSMPFLPVSGTLTHTAKKLGGIEIGLFQSRQ